MKSIYLAVCLFSLLLAGCGSNGTPTGGNAGSGGDMAGSTSNPAAHCSTASDCRLYSSYCMSRPCECLALDRGAVDPPCVVGNQSCLVDPCLHKSVDCQANLCVVIGN